MRNSKADSCHLTMTEHKRDWAKLSLLCAVISYSVSLALLLRRMKADRERFLEVIHLYEVLGNLQQVQLSQMRLEREQLLNKYLRLCQSCKDQAPQVWNSYVAQHARDKTSQEKGRPQDYTS